MTRPPYNLQSPLERSSFSEGIPALAEVLGIPWIETDGGGEVAYSGGCSAKKLQRYSSIAKSNGSVSRA